MKEFISFLLILCITSCISSPVSEVIDVNTTDVSPVCPTVTCKTSCDQCHNVLPCECPECHCHDETSDENIQYTKPNCPSTDCTSVDTEENLKTNLNRIASCNRGFWWTTRTIERDMTTFDDLKEVINSYNQSHMLQLWKSLKLDQKIKFEDYYKAQKNMDDPFELKSCDLEELKYQFKNFRALNMKLTSQSNVIITTLLDSEMLLANCKVEKSESNKISRKRRDLSNNEDIEDTSKEFADTDYEFDCNTAMEILKLKNKEIKDEIKIEKFKHEMAQTCVSAILESETFIKNQFSDYIDEPFDEKMSLLLIHYTNVLNGAIDGHTALSSWGNKNNFPCHRLQGDIETMKKSNMELLIKILIDNKKLQDVLVQLKQCDKETTEDKLKLASELQLTTIGGRKYYFQHDKKTKWKTANDFCLSHGMHLVIIDNDDEQDSLREVITTKMRRPITFRSYWTDGIQLAVGYPLAVWNSTRIPINYSHIVPPNLQLAKRSFVYFGRTPNEDFLWGLSPCTTNRHFICEQY